MPPQVRPTLYSVCDLYAFNSSTNLDSSVSQGSVIITKLNRFLIRFKLVIRSANLPVVLRAFTVRTDKLLYLSFLSNSDHSTLEP